MSELVHWRVVIVDGEGLTSSRQVYLDAATLPESLMAESVDALRRSGGPLSYPLTVHVWRDES